MRILEWILDLVARVQQLLGRGAADLAAGNEARRQREQVERADAVAEHQPERRNTYPLW